MRKLNEIDKKILFELDKNARRSINQIAKVLKLKRDTVAYRIKQLESNKTIKKYYTVINYAKLGYILTRLYIKFQNTTLETEEKIINDLVKSKTTFTVYKAEGDWDIAIGFLSKSLEEFNKVLQNFLKKYKKYIHEHDVAVFLEYLHYFRNYLVEKQQQDYTAISTGKGENVNFDETGILILKILAENAKIPLLQIAQKLKLTSMAVRYRIKQLEKKGIILGYRALIDYRKFGYEYYKIDITIEDMNKIKQLQQFVQQHPNVVFEDRTIGGSDFEFDIELSGYDAFYRLIGGIKKQFPGIIRTYKYYKARKIYKYIYFPE